jgi:AGCS family alanine or glycine:cation symporter
VDLRGGMTLKFSESTLAQLYRKKNPDGSISGGAMYYLDLGLREYGPVLGAFGKILAVFYALMIMAGAMGGGNMFQANQSFEAIVPTFGIPESSKAFASVVFGLIMAFMVGLVIIGGIKRIGAATSKIVPFMCGIYVLAAIFIMFWNIEAIPGTFGTIFSQAFGDNAFFGGIIGVAVMGIRRASFSNEAGLGSSAIAHAAAKTDEPVREGIVAMLEPFIDTIVVCSMTAFVVIVTDTYRAEAFWGVSDAGASMTVAAFDTVIPHFSYVLTICILLFAYSTMISWCYYGERGWIYLMDHFGEGTGLRTLLGFRVVFCMFVFFGSVIKLGQVLEFSDLVILCLAFPNLLGSMILLPKIVPIVNDYWRRFQAGEFKVYK